MAYQFPPDVAALIEQTMASGAYASEDDLLREALQALIEEAEDLALVREAIDELRAGDEGQDIKEGFSAIRSKYKLDTNS